MSKKPIEIEQEIEISANLIALIALLLFGYVESETLAQNVLSKDVCSDDEIMDVLMTALSNYTVKTFGGMEQLQDLYNKEEIDALFAICNSQFKL